MTPLLFMSPGEQLLFSSWQIDKGVLNQSMNTYWVEQNDLIFDLIWFSDPKKLNIGSNKKTQIKFGPIYLKSWNDLKSSKNVFFYVCWRWAQLILISIQVGV